MITEKKKVYILKIVCMYCGRVMRLHKDYRPGISHSVCDDCYDAKLKEWKQKEILP